MARSQQLVKLVQNIESTAKGVAEAGDLSVKQSALALKNHANRNIGAATGGDGRISGGRPATGAKRKKIGPVLPDGGKRIHVRYNKHEIAGGATAMVYAKGPLQLVENDVDPHVVVSRHSGVASSITLNAKGKRVKTRNSIANRRAQVLAGNGAAGGGRRAVLHWGSNYARWTMASSKGRQPWGKALDSELPKMRRRSTGNVGYALRHYGKGGR